MADSAQQTQGNAIIALDLRPKGLKSVYPGISIIIYKCWLFFITIIYNIIYIVEILISTQATEDEYRSFKLCFS